MDNEKTLDQLERYAFLWSISRLVIAAVSLFFGAMPIAYKLGGVAYSLLPLFWLVSGVAAAYLLYQWHQSKHRLFERDNETDRWTFLVMGVTGINLGITAVSTNIGLSIAMHLGPLLYGLLVKATALLYLFVAYHLFKAWRDNGQKLFSDHELVEPVPSAQDSLHVTK